jgi:hypothetical protein
MLLVASPALAADYCLSLLDGGNLYVGKKFKLPKKGKCASWSGFCTSLCAANVQTGTACTSADGTQTSFQITTAYLGSANRESASIALEVETQAGTADVLSYNPTSSSSFDSSVTGARCNVPVP